MTTAPPATGTLEQELKLGARPGFEMPDLADVVAGASVVAEPALDLDATYVDTADLQLVRNGVSLRRRTGEGAPRWTLKLPKGRKGATLLRREIDVEDPGDTVPAELAALVTGWVRSAALEPVIVIRSHRDRLRLVDDEGRVLAEIDDDQVTVVDDGEVAAHFREVEVELGEHGSPELLGVVGDALVAAGAGAPDPTSKVVRALGPRALVPSDLAAGLPGEGATVGDVVGAALRASVAAIVGSDHVVRLDDDADGVHRMRVALRRLRSDLRTARPVLVEGFGAAWLPGMRELTATTGAVRDTDVLLARLDRSVGALPPEDQESAIAVRRGAERQRREQHALLRLRLAEPRYVELLDALVAGALAPDFGEAAGRPAADAVPGLVQPAWRRLQRAVDGLGAEPTDDALHAVRILAKRARYACDLAAPVVGDDAVALADAISGVQDALGAVHDAVLAEAWLRRAARVVGPADLFAVGELVVLERQQAAAAREAWPAAWDACGRKGLTRWLR